MSEKRTDHLDETRLLAWIDEPEAEAEPARLQAHLAACGECRARAAELRSLLSALAAPAPAPDAAAFGAQRERILAALPERRAGGRGGVATIGAWRAWWIPTLAAAALAALLVAWPGSREAPDGPPTATETDVPLPVQAAAQAAADEVFELADVAATDDPAPAAAGAPIEAVPLMEDEPPTFAELELEFAELPAEDQTAILDELAIATFEL